MDLDSVSNATIWSLAIAGSVGVGVGKPAATTTGGGAGGQGGTGVGVAISSAVTVNVVDNRTVSYIDQDSHVMGLASGAVSLDAKTIHRSWPMRAASTWRWVPAREPASAWPSADRWQSTWFQRNPPHLRFDHRDGCLSGRDRERDGGGGFQDLGADDRRVPLRGIRQEPVRRRFAGAVAGSVNSVRNTVEAGVSDSAVVGSAGISIGATDGTAIIANAVGGSLSVGAGKTGLAMAVGGAFAINAIGNTVRSYVDGSSLDVNGRLAIAATSDS